MEEDFRALLLAGGSVSAIVADRIDWGSSPQGYERPAVVLTVISDSGGHTLVGIDGLSMGRVQVDCYAPTYASAKLLSRAVRDLLDGYRGGGFRAILHAGTRDEREAGSNEADRPFRVSLDFMTYWRN